MVTEVVISGRSKWGDFPGGPVVKTLSSDAGGTGPIPGWGAKIPHASWPKNQNRKQKQYSNKLKTLKMVHVGTSLVVHWLIIHQSMQGTQIQSLVWEGSTCPRATKPMSHNY